MSGPPSLRRLPLSHVAAILLAVLLLAAAFGKVSDFPRFVDQIAGYSIVPNRWIEPAACLLVAGEALLGLLLLFPRTRVAAAPPAAALFLVFAAAVGASVANGRANDCGCALPFFGGADASAWIVVRNLGLAALALAVGGEIPVPLLSPQRAGDTPLRRIARLQWWGMVALFLHLGAVARQLEVLHAELEADFTQLVRLRPGDPFEHLHVETLAGEARTLEYAVGRHEVLVFSAQCANCPVAIDCFSAIASLPGGPPTTRYDLSLSTAEETRALLESRNATFPVYRLTDLRAARQHGLLKLPTAVVVEAGVVTYSGFVPELRVGQPFTGVSVETLDGRDESLEFAGCESELIVLTRDCDVCTGFAEAMDATAQAGRRRRLLWLHDAPVDAARATPGAALEQRIWRDIDSIRRHGSSLHHRRIVVGADATIRELEWLPAAE